jgi:hypothetical protein
VAVTHYGRIVVGFGYKILGIFAHSCYNIFSWGGKALCINFAFVSEKGGTAASARQVIRI